MRKKIKLIFILCFPALLFAQDKTDGNLAGITTDLEVGHEFQMEENSVRFLKVISDSRCPRQVTCIWQGEAKVLLGVNLNGNYFEKEVVISGSGAEMKLAENLQLQVSNLRPYPQDGSTIAPEKYCLRFAAIFPVED